MTWSNPALPYPQPQPMNEESSPYWNALVPELAVTSLEASLRCYLAAGFSVRFRREDPPFAYLVLGGAQLMLEELHADSWRTAPLQPPLGRGMNLQIEVPDATAVSEAVSRAGFTPFQALEEQWYAVSDTEEEGQIEFLVQDPDGYLLRFCQPLGSRSRVLAAPSD